MRTIRPVILAGFLAALCVGASAVTMAILYSPDSVVDLVPTQNDVEPSIAADPLEPGTLIAADESGSFNGVDLYVSNDGGYNWRPSALPLSGVSPLGDVQVAAGPRALYFAFLGQQKGYERGGIQFFTSTDHGNTFGHTAFVHASHSYDHEQLTVDTGDNRYRGRIMMSALYSVKDKPQVNACGLLWSDDGRVFYGPVRVVTGWCFNSKPVALADGRILFPYIYIKKFGDSVAKVEVAISRDGGRSFGAPHVIGTYTALTAAGLTARLHSGEADFDGDPVPQYAAHGEDVYAVWSDLAQGTSRLLFARSSDGGVRWTSPRTIVAPGDVADAQYQASINVNAQGTLALAFLRADAATKTVTEMFTASTDGGQTFLQPVAVQSTPARLDAMQSSGYAAAAEHVQGQIFVGFSSPGSRFTSGGDYVGMAADGNGAFHPIWVDARSGTDQVWTATARIGAAPSPPATLTSANVSDDVDLQFGTGSWDAATHVYAVPVRLHNAGTRTLYPPFTVTVVNVHDPWAPGSEKYDSPPVFENAHDGKSGVGATFVYGAGQLGNLGVLPPGADSAPIIWRVRIGTAAVEPSMVTRVDGNVSR
jgi:hypothetical protein